jgi:hypothetical protein
LPKLSKDFQIFQKRSLGIDAGSQNNGKPQKAVYALMRRDERKSRKIKKKGASGNFKRIGFRLLKNGELIKSSSLGGSKFLRNQFKKF